MTATTAGPTAGPPGVDGPGCEPGHRRRHRSSTVWSEPGRGGSLLAGSSPRPRVSAVAALVAALAAALLLGACGGGPSGNADRTATRVPPATFAGVVAKPETFVLNVHTPDEGSIPGTDAEIPFDRLRTRADELPADLSARIAVYCRTGRMSTLAVATLGDLGYTEVVELEGGMEAWREDGRVLLPADRASREQG